MSLESVPRSVFRFMHSSLFFFAKCATGAKTGGMQSVPHQCRFVVLGSDWTELGHPSPSASAKRRRRDLSQPRPISGQMEGGGRSYQYQGERGEAEGKGERTGWGEEVSYEVRK